MCAKNKDKSKSLKLISMDVHIVSTDDKKVFKISIIYMKRKTKFQNWNGTVQKYYCTAQSEIAIKPSNQ